MKKRNIITFVLSLLMTISTAFVLNSVKSNTEVQETKAETVLSTPKIEWNNVDYKKWAPNLDDLGVPQEGYVLLVTYEGNLSSATITDKNLINAGLSGCNVNDHILINGVKSEEIANAFVYCFPQNGIFIYVPNASITMTAQYEYPTIEFLEGMSIDGSATTIASRFEYRGALKSFGNWKLNPEPIVREKAEFNKIEWNNVDYSKWCPNCSDAGIPQEGYVFLAFFNEPNKTPDKSVIGDTNHTGRGVIGNGGLADHMIKANGVDIVDVANSAVYIYPAYGLYVYIPEASLTYDETYKVPTIEIEGNLHFNDKVNLPSVVLEFTGKLGKQGGWAVKKGPADYNHFPFTCINGLWNNVNFGTTPGYNQLILEFGVNKQDYLANDKTRESTNRATEAYDIGKKLSINGLPIYKIHEKFSGTKVGYDHGDNYFFVSYPVEILMPTESCLVPTLHIEENAIFMDTMLPEVTLKFCSNKWFASDSTDFKIEEPDNIDTYLMPELFLPHVVGTNSHAILAALPEEGVSLAFNINSGNVSGKGPDATLNLDGLYGCTVALMPNVNQIVLLDNYVPAEVFSNFIFSDNTTYNLEIEVVCGETTTFKVAINHFLVIDHVFEADKTKTCDLWGIDTSGEFTIDYYEENPFYVPSIIFGGVAEYDFNEGDSLYDFNGVAKAINLYSDGDSGTISFKYEEGAATDNKYNAGTWVLTIQFDFDGYPSISKEVIINVHSKVGMAKIYYGDADPIEVEVGSHLVPPPNPNTYHDEEYDYVFDGWYFEGYKWDFVTGIVEGDMHFVPHFKPSPLHYVVTAVYEGVDRPSDRFSLTKGSYLPFDVFEFDGATYEVYLDGEVTTSLKVETDITITVKYTVVYTYVAPKESTCTEDGNIGYWYSAIYGNYYFADPNGREIIDDVLLPKSNHKIVHLDAKNPTCAEVGNVDCYYCENCHKHFEDENGEIELINWSIAKLPHDLTHHAGIPATCEEDGVLEHWTCANEPGVIYGDELCLFTLETTVIEAHGHAYLDTSYEWKAIDGGFECVATIKCVNCEKAITETKVATKTLIREATCEKDGLISYSVTFDNPMFSAQTKLISVPKIAHTYTFVAQVEATEQQDGIKEHYICNDCNKYFIKDGETYKEVQFSELIIKFKKKEEKKGCGGSIIASSLVLTLSATAIALLVLVRRKEEK